MRRGTTHDVQIDEWSPLDASDQISAPITRPQMTPGLSNVFINCRASGGRTNKPADGEVITDCRKHAGVAEKLENPQKKEDMIDPLISKIVFCFFTKKL